MTPCPYCHAPAARIARTRMNAVRVCASLVLFPFYMLGGLAGDQRGPFLPLERRCSVCGRHSKARSVIDEVRSIWKVD